MFPEAAVTLAAARDPVPGTQGAGRSLVLEARTRPRGYGPAPKGQENGAQLLPLSLGLKKQ